MARTAYLSAEDDLRLRQEAMKYIDDLPKEAGGLIRQRQLEDFTFDGIRIPLMDRQLGIRKPAALDTAISIRTVFTPHGEKPPYEDELGEDGLQRYNYIGTDPEHPQNVGLRNAYLRKLPLIWFVGTKRALYIAHYPLWIIGEEPEKHQFILAACEEQKPENTGNIESPAQKKYLKRLTKLRLHQKTFSAKVKNAYRDSCAMCGLHYPELVDAAHIIPDSDPDGVPEVSNGIALCKLHHAAYDKGFIRIRPDNFILEVRTDVLTEKSSEPMLLHGLQGLHGQRLRVPTSAAHKPSRAALLKQYNKWAES